MKKHILYILALAACANANAQTEKIEYLPEMVSVTEDVLTVELKSTDTPVKVESRHAITDEKENTLGFKLIGTKGKVDIPSVSSYSFKYDGESNVEVDNADIFVRMFDVAEYSANVLLQKNVELFGDYYKTNYGFYISKNPEEEATNELHWNLYTISGTGEDAISNLLKNGACVDVQAYSGGEKVAKLIDLENNTTYYVRPYVNITTPDGPGKMFGGTETFTTPYTVWVVINNETYYRSKFYDYNSTDALLSKDAVDAFCKKYADRVGEGEISRQIVIKSWIDFLAKNPDLMETMKALNSTKKEECTDGIAYLVSAVPVEYEAVLLEDMLSGTVVTDFDASLNEETDVTGWSQPWASAGYGEHKWVETDSNPYGGYYLLEPYSDTSTAKYAFELPKLFVPGKYNIYITFAQGIGEEDVQKNKFTAFAYEYDMNLGGYLYPGNQLIAEDEHADGRNIIIDTTNGCDTICLTADLAGKIIIQLQPGGKTAELRQGIYTKTMRIAEIKVVPAETK